MQRGVSLDEELSWIDQRRRAEALMDGRGDEAYRTPLRVRYFDGQLLTAQDFRDEQQYHLEKQRLHNRLLHGVGIVTGLEVVVVKGTTVQVRPGLALDSHGREIIVPDPQRTDAAQPTNEEGQPEGERIAKGVVSLRVGYREIDVEQGSLPAGEEKSPSRTAEVYSLMVSPDSPVGSDNGIVLATIRVDGDSIEVLRGDQPRKKATRAPDTAEETRPSGRP
jgi:hypothetical protein